MSFIHGNPIRLYVEVVIEDFIAKLKKKIRKFLMKGI